jgi:hypothetical protein
MIATDSRFRVQSQQRTSLNYEYLPSFALESDRVATSRGYTQPLFLKMTPTCACLYPSYILNFLRPLQVPSLP